MSARSVLLWTSAISGGVFLYLCFAWRIGRMLRRNVSEPLVVYPRSVERDEFDRAVARLLAEESA